MTFPESMSALLMSLPSVLRLLDVSSTLSIKIFPSDGRAAIVILVRSDDGLSGSKKLKSV